MSAICQFMEIIAIIGAGAAGCFCAIELKRRHPDARVTVYEAASKPMAKLAVTGGGRCNLSNTFENISRLREAYPRGEKLVRHAFKALSPEQTLRWWEKEGVRLTVMQDGCVFPVSQDAMQIVRTLGNLMRRLGVELRLGCKVEAVEHRPQGKGYVLSLRDARVEADRVVVTTGGGALKLLAPLGLDIVPPVPSLFTFKLKDEGLRSLMGTVVEDATLSLAGLRNMLSRGTLLLTDWGVSGPATLKLSSYAARELAGSGYRGTLLVNWLSCSEAQAREWIAEAVAGAARRQVSSVRPDALTARLWQHLMRRAGLREDIRWAEMGPKGIARLACTLTADAYELDGRCRFKEEFVTAGGVSASAVLPQAFEAREHPGLHFAGEVLDIDAITGGFNLQAAWSTAFAVASQSGISEENV